MKNLQIAGHLKQVVSAMGTPKKTTTIFHCEMRDPESGIYVPFKMTISDEEEEHILTLFEELIPDMTEITAEVKVGRPQQRIEEIVVPIKKPKPKKHTE